MALSKKQQRIVDQLARRVELCREFMNDWLLFNQVLSAYPKQESNKAQLEGQFLKIKSKLAREHRVLKDTLQADYNIDNWSINFNQALFDAPAWHGYQQAKINTQKAAYDLRTAEQDLIYRVAEVYGNALVAQGNLRVSEAEKDSLAEQLELDRERLKVGLGTITNVYATESRYSLAETNVIEADFALR